MKKDVLMTLFTWMKTDIHICNIFFVLKQVSLLFPHAAEDIQLIG